MKSLPLSSPKNRVSVKRKYISVYVCVYVCVCLYVYVHVHLFKWSPLPLRSVSQII